MSGNPIPTPAPPAALVNQLVQLKAERDALAAALADATHEFEKGQLGITTICFECYASPGSPKHQTPDRVLAGLAAAATTCPPHEHEPHTVHPPSIAYAAEAAAWAASRAHDTGEGT